MKNIIKIALISLIISGAFTASVSYADNLPIWSPISTKFSEVGRPLQFLVFASDLENDELDYYALYLPLGATFDRYSHIFRWIPNRAGNYVATFRVFDGFNSYSDMSVKIKVENTPPSIGAQGGGTSGGGGVVTIIQPTVPPKIYIINSPKEIIKETVVIRENYVSETTEIDSTETESTDTETLEDEELYTASLIGVLGAIFLNPWLLVLVILILVFLLYRSKRKQREAEQLLNGMKK